jgi:uncharacterized membrane protein YfhO
LNNAVSDNTSKRNLLVYQYCIFSLLFVVTSFFCFFFFIALHKSFLRYDGIVQHLTALTYWDEYLRTFLKTLFTTGKFVFPEFDFSIGYGDDILTTLHYYTIGDPLSLLSVFVPAAKTEYLYNFLVILRLYLCGISFLAYCNYHKLVKWASLTGAFIYIFSGYSLYCAVRHPYFINPMIYLPVIFIGVDKIIKNENPALFIISIFVACISNFYFFYMLTIITIIYAVIRFFATFNTGRGKKFCKLFTLFAGFYILGTAMASVVFLPNVLGFFNSCRSGDKAIVPLLYDPIYYVKAVFSFVSPEQFESYSFFGFAAFTFSACILCFLRKDAKSKQLKAGLIVLSIFMAFPVFGHIFNGFNYVTNRWCFAYAFTAALTTTCLLPELLTMTKKEFLIYTVIPSSVCFFVIAGSILINLIKTEFLLSHTVLLLVLFLFAVLYMHHPDMKNRKVKYLTYSFFLGCTLFSIIINANIRYSPKQYNYLTDFFDYGKAYTNYSSDIDSRLKEMTSDTDFFRYEEPKKLLKNNAMLFNSHSTAFYWSVCNSYVSEALNQLGATSQGWQSSGFDIRSIPDALTCVEYIVLTENLKTGLPYNFIKKESSNQYKIYENKNPLPFGFTYNKYISDSVFKQLSCSEKQSVLLDYAVIHGTSPVETAKNVPNFTILRPDFTVTSAGKNIVTAKKLQIKDSTSKILLIFSSIPNTETYLNIEGIFHTNKSVKPSITVTDDTGATQRIKISNSEHQYGHNFLINLGYHETSIHSVTLQFDTEGTYTFDKFRIECLPLNDFNKKLDALKKDSLQNIQFQHNSFTGNISIAEPEFLCLSLPYSKGWKAYVDGIPEIVYNTQIMLSGIFLKPGNHAVKFVYHTPGLFYGAILSVAAIIIFILICIIFNYLKKKNNQ